MKTAIRIIMALGLAVGLYNLVVADLAFSEQIVPPGEDDEWIVHDQVLVPEDGRAAVGTVILVHGYGGSPLDFRTLAPVLAERGFRVVAPITPGQGRDVNAFRRGEITAEITLDWLRSVILGETARAGGKKPHLVGFSMGGALATVVAAEDRVDRLVLLGPFYSLPTADGLIRLAAGAVEPLVPVVPKPWKGNIFDPVGYAEYRPGTYLVSLGAFQRLEELAGQAKAASVDLDRPTLLLGSGSDVAASFEVARGLFEDRDNVTIKEFPRSNHILLYDHDREEVVRLVADFLEGD
jgi:alpha-beta hydrolase superfamily lysophospholipase